MEEALQLQAEEVELDENRCTRFSTSSVGVVCESLDC
jgi:hypothetical protein